MGLVVSHIYSSADALTSFEIDAAYDPNNALLLSANVDKHFDTYKITFDNDGKVIFSMEAFPNLINEVVENGYYLDAKILNKDRKKYMIKHREKYHIKNNLDIKAAAESKVEY